MRQNQNHHLATLPNHPQSVESQFINNKKVCLFYLLIISINQMAKGLQEDHGAMTQVTRNWDVTIEQKLLFIIELQLTFKAPLNVKN